MGDGQEEPKRMSVKELQKKLMAGGGGSAPPMPGPVGGPKPRPPVTVSHALPQEKPAEREASAAPPVENSPPVSGVAALKKQLGGSPGIRLPGMMGMPGAKPPGPAQGAAASPASPQESAAPMGHAQEGSPQTPPGGSSVSQLRSKLGAIPMMGMMGGPPPSLRPKPAASSPMEDGTPPLGASESPATGGKLDHVTLSRPLGTPNRRPPSHQSLVAGALLSESPASDAGGAQENDDEMDPEELREKVFRMTIADRHKRVGSLDFSG
eukprot:jgi/Mesvir1/15228/Mv06455-RA.1